ncbi:response regulator [bacterium]|nr:response regulator [bacterium]
MPNSSVSAARLTVLVCDDEKNMRRVLEDILRDDGWEVHSVGSAEEVLKLHKEGRRFDAMVIDLSLPVMNGLDLIDRLKELGSESGVVVITAYGSLDAAVKAMKQGAVDFLVKPFENSQIKGALRKIRESRGLIADVEFSHPTLVGADNAPLNFVGRDPRLTDIFRVIKQIASLKTAVLINGESGTGKELVAQAIHYNGARRHQPFVPINCAALPETLLESEFFGHERGAFTGAHALVRGKFEVADHGTLFLDEIGDMPMSLQVKLLRALQEQRFTRVGGEKEISVDVRVIAATNREMGEAVRLKQFREDLYYRLNVIPIHLPPLRERREDIPHLVEYFLKRFAKRHNMTKLTLSQEQLNALQQYNWPGNIRELQNTCEKATVLQDVGALVAPALGRTPNPLAIMSPGTTGEVDSSGLITRRAAGEDDFLLDLGQGATIRDLGDVAADAQRAAVIRALKLCGGNKSEAAKKLGISYKTLFNKIEDLGIRISTTVD